MELAGLEPATSWVRSTTAPHQIELVLPANPWYLGTDRFAETGWFRLNSAGFRPTDGSMGLNVLGPPTSG
jgi:hypothetical protein